MIEEPTDSDQQVRMIRPEQAEYDLRVAVAEARIERIERDIPHLVAYFNDLFETAVDPELWEPEPETGWYRCPLETFDLLARWSLEDHPETRVDSVPTWHFYVQAKLDPPYIGPAYLVTNRVDLGSAVARVDAARQRKKRRLTRSGAIVSTPPAIVLNPDPFDR